MKKRLGIFLFFNPWGVVHDYVPYLLNDISRCLDELIIICNGFITADGRSKLERFTPSVYVRPNEGFDFAAWKEGIVDICGIDHVKSFDELVLFNDSFFGPLYPFSEVFARMDQDEAIDFWGLSSHGAVHRGGELARPAYLQTYFLVFRNSLLRSEDFASYWNNLEMCETFEEHVENVASKFTDYFARKGYSWTCYAPTFDFEDIDGFGNMSHHMYNSYEMVVNRRLPIIKRKTFMMPLNAFLNYADAGVLPKTLKYIHEETGYDTRLIWDYLLKTCHLSDLMSTLSLRAVLPSAEVENRQGSPAANHSIAVIAHLFYDDLFDESLSMLAQAPKGVDVFVTTSDTKKRDTLLEMAGTYGVDNLEVRVVNNRGRDVSALLVGCKDVVLSHEYVCYLHDKKSAHNQFVQPGRFFAELLKQCMLASPEYIENVIGLLEANPCLGLLVPPKTYHATHFGKYATSFWTICYDKTLDVLSRLNLSVPMTRAEDCVAVGTAFWFRSEALRPLFEENWTVLDFPTEPLPTDGSISHALERSIPYIAQSQGFYTSEVMPDYLAEEIVADYRFMLDRTVATVDENKAFHVDDATFAVFHRTLAASVTHKLNSTRRAILKRFYKAVERRIPIIEKPKDAVKKRFKNLWSKI